MTLFGSIQGFVGKYSFLSNFWPSPVEFGGETYPTVEHAYQAAKTFDLAERERIKNLSHPGQAKRAGRKVTIRDDWENVKVSIMEELVYQKFTKDDTLRLQLCATESIFIEETNTWGDTFWGVCNGKGKNVLGNILMHVRKEIADDVA